MESNHTAVDAPPLPGDVRGVKHPTPYETAFARWLGVEHAFSFWKGRVALYAGLKALGVTKGDEVIIPGYTCVMAVNPIMYLGATPVYVDIDPITYNAVPELIEASITGHTKVIIVQHTYGYPSDMDAIMAIADRRGIAVIEDCCLAMGSRWNGRPVGTFGVAAYFSSQWSKPFTTGLGGVLVTRDCRLAESVAALRERESSPPRARSVAMLRVQLAAHRALVYPKTTALAQSIFRWLGRIGLVVASSSDDEFRPDMPDGFFTRMSAMQARAGVAGLSVIDRNLAHRRMMRATYDDLLKDAGWRVPPLPAAADPVLVRYPVRVADKERALALAPRRFVEIGSWFECPLHPQETPLARYGYESGMCPVAEQAGREVVNLPLHARAGVATAKCAVAFVTDIGPARHA